MEKWEVDVFIYFFYLGYVLYYIYMMYNLNILKINVYMCVFVYFSCSGCFYVCIWYFNSYIVISSWLC